MPVPSFTATPTDCRRPCYLSAPSTARAKGKAREICLERLTKAILMCRKLTSDPLKYRIRRCPEAHRHWGAVDAAVLANLALENMSDEAVSAVVSRGRSVVESGQTGRSAEEHAGPGIYIQVVRHNGTRRSVYVGKSDCGVRARQRQWSRNYRDPKCQAKIVLARRSPDAIRFAAIAALSLQASLGWYTVTHRGLNLASARAEQDLEEEDSLDLRNTLCSTFEAPFIAAMGTHNGKTYDRLWAKTFGGDMAEVNGANVQIALEGNWKSTKRLREAFQSQSKRCTLRRGAFLEEDSKAVIHQDEAGVRVTVGDAPLDTFVAR